LISFELFWWVRDTFAGREKPKYPKHDFAFAGLLACAHDEYAVRTELHEPQKITT